MTNIISRTALVGRDTIAALANKLVIDYRDWTRFANKQDAYSVSRNAEQAGRCQSLAETLELLTGLDTGIWMNAAKWAGIPAYEADRHGGMATVEAVETSNRSTFAE